MPQPAPHPRGSTSYSRYVAWYGNTEASVITLPISHPTSRSRPSAGSDTLLRDPKATPPRRGSTAAIGSLSLHHATPRITGIDPFSERRSGVCTKPPFRRGSTTGHVGDHRRLNPHRSGIDRSSKARSNRPITPVWGNFDGLRESSPEQARRMVAGSFQKMHPTVSCLELVSGAFSCSEQRSGHAAGPARSIIHRHRPLGDG
jgi:hypothetical protein